MEEVAAEASIEAAAAVVVAVASVEDVEAAVWVTTLGRPRGSMSSLRYLTHVKV